MSHGCDVAAAAGEVPPATTTPPARATAAPHSPTCRNLMVNLFLTNDGQWGAKSWLVPGAFLHGHWSSCWPALLPAPSTSRHRPLLRFWNSKEPSDCARGCHRPLADPLGTCWTMSGLPAAVALLATATSSPEFSARSSPAPPEPGRNWNCWLVWPLQFHWSIAAPAVLVLPATSRHRLSLATTSWCSPLGKPVPEDDAGVR